MLFFVLDHSSSPLPPNDWVNVIIGGNQRKHGWNLEVLHRIVTRAFLATDTLRIGLRQVLKCSTRSACGVADVCQEVQNEALIGGQRSGRREM